jgi:hypothetical protein
MSEEGIIRKALSFWYIMNYQNNEAPANTRASRRGNTRGAGVVPNDWALRVCRL